MSRYTRHAPLNMHNHTTACSICNKSQESVRKAAGIAYKSLHKVTVRACDGAAMDKIGSIMIIITMLAGFSVLCILWYSTFLNFSRYESGRVCSSPST